MSLIHTGLATPGWRWIKDRLWGLYWGCRTFIHRRLSK